MHVLLSYTAADVIDGRIYVIGRLRMNLYKMMVLVFNTETQTWETDSEMTTCETKARDMYNQGGVVMADKMYTKCSCNGFVYDPKERKWETNDSKGWRFACVIDDVLYYYDKCYGKELRAYDRKQRCWLVVKGLDLKALLETSLIWSHTESDGGKLALFFSEGEEISCAEISLERSQEGEIWGKVEWCNCLVTGTGRKFHYTKSLNVVV